MSNVNLRAIIPAVVLSLEPDMNFLPNSNHLHIIRLSIRRG